MRTRYEVRTLCGTRILASMTLYGEPTPETDAALLTLMREAMAIDSVRGRGTSNPHVQQVCVRREFMEDL